MNGDTTVVVQLASIFGTLTDATLLSSEDLENWHSGVAVSVPGSAPLVAFTTLVGLGAPYCRLKLTANTDAIVNVEYSPAMSTEGKTGMRVELRAIYASGTIAAAATVEQSVDVVNWSAPLFTVSTLTTAPTSATGVTNSTSSATLAGYVRVKFTNTANKACVAAVVDFFDYVP